MEEEKLATIDIRELALKCTTKEEVYRVLVTSGEIYLPPVQQINCDFISDILSGDKSYIACDKVRMSEVPHIEGLRIPDILAFAAKHCNISLYLPEYDCEKYPSRKWICNVVNSLIHENFKKFVNDRIEENNKQVDDIKGNKFQILPTMAKVLTESKLSSKRHGRFHQLIKNSKRKRINREKAADKDNERKEISELIERQVDEIERLKDELNEYKEKIEYHERDSDILKQLYQDGFIDLDGKPIIKDS